MKHTKEEILEIRRYEEILKYKEKIRTFIFDFFKQEMELNILSLEDEVLPGRFYSSVIAKLNEAFYGFNVSDQVKELRNNKIVVADGNLVNVLPANHLRYYHQIMKSYYYTIMNTKSINHNSFIALAKITGNDAYNCFLEENNGITPYQDLLLKLLKEKKETTRVVDVIKKLAAENKALKKENNILKRERKYII